MADEAGGAGVTLPPEIEALIKQQSAELQPTAAQTSSPIISPGVLAGGVSATPIAENTILVCQFQVAPSYPLPAAFVAFLNARILLPNLDVTYCQWGVTQAQITAGTFSTELAPGYLLSLAVLGAGANIPPGVVFAVAGLAHSQTQSGPFDTVLCQGYLVGTNFLAWPAGLLESDYDSPGWAGAMTPANPGAGNNSAITVVDRLFAVDNVSFTLTAGAAVATRVPVVLYNPAGRPAVAVGVAPTGQVASTAWAYTFASGLQAQTLAAQFIQTAPLQSPLLARINGVLQVTVNGIQPADALTSIAFTGRFWL
jgi:hypothetical protein